VLMLETYRAAGVCVVRGGRRLERDCSSRSVGSLVRCCPAALVRRRDAETSPLIWRINRDEIARRRGPTNCRRACRPSSSPRPRCDCNRVFEYSNVKQVFDYLFAIVQYRISFFAFLRLFVNIIIRITDRNKAIVY